MTQPVHETVSSPRSLSSYDYSWATSRVTSDVPDDAQPPLPRIIEPETLPPAPAPGGESLVPISHRKIRVLSTYWHAGWSSARPEALARSGVVERLCAVAEALPDGFGLAVFDAWRPLRLQREIYEAAYADPNLPPGFVSVPSTDPVLSPPHLTGGTIDVTLTWKGTPLQLGTTFDDFSSAAATDALESTPSRERELRRLLFWTMYSKGFVVVDCEWWHFEYGTRRWAALTGTSPIYGAATI